MFKSIWLAVLILMAGSEELTYRPKADAGPVQSELTYTVTLTGPPVLTSQLLSANPALSIQQLRTTRKGQRVFTGGANGESGVQIATETARVEGRTKDKPFQFDFNQSAAPADLAADPIRQFAWSFSMAPRRYTLSPKGDYRLTDAGQDTQAEAIGVIIDAPVHFPDQPIAAGDQFSHQWNGIPRKKDGAIFHYRQNARVEEIVAGASPRARVSFTTSAILYDSAGKPLQTEDARVEAKGSILLDLQKGVVVGLDSTGTISTEIKAANLKIAFGYTSKSEMPDAAGAR